MYTEIYGPAAEKIVGQYKDDATGSSPAPSYKRPRHNDHHGGGGGGGGRYSSSQRYGGGGGYGGRGGGYRQVVDILSEISFLRSFSL